MKTFHQFINEIKTINYPMAKSHTVYLKGKPQKVSAGKAVPFNPGGGGRGCEEE